MRKFFNQLITEAKGAIRAPTTAQRKAYGSLLLTFSSASCIGAFTIVFIEPLGLVTIAKAALLLTWGVVLALLGAILSKEE